MLEPTGIDAVLAADLRRHEAVMFDAPETEFELWLTSVSAETEEILRIFEDAGVDIYAAFRVARENGWL